MFARKLSRYNLWAFLIFDILSIYGAKFHHGIARMSGVPRYYFHFSDGKRRFSDTTGHDLSGLTAVRAHAINQVRDLKAAMCDPGIQDTSGWTMTVLDAHEQLVFEIGFDMKVKDRLS